MNKWRDRSEIFFKEFQKCETSVTLFLSSWPYEWDQTLLLNLQFFSPRIPALEHAFLLHGYKFKRSLAPWFN